MLKADDGVIDQDVDLDHCDWPIDEVHEMEPFLGSITIKGTKYDLHGNTREVFVYNATPIDNVYQCVADIPLSKRVVGGITTYHPDYTRVDNRYQGKGIMTRIYIEISKLLDIRIRSGNIQSPGSVKLWYKLAKNRNTQMLVFRRREGWQEVFIDDKRKEIICDWFSPYDCDSSVAVFQAV